jgi:hypothetical protein
MSGHAYQWWAIGAVVLAIRVHATLHTLHIRHVRRRRAREAAEAPADEELKAASPRP